MTSVDAVFVGRIRPLGPEGKPSAIVKEPVAGTVIVGLEGVEGDEHGNPQAHGGPHMAVHYFPAPSYAVLATERPELVSAFVPGSIGENLSGGLTEADVCIGDVFRVGAVVLEVSQLRRPCWKIEARFEAEGLIDLIDRVGCPGWYFRVLVPGSFEVGDELVLVERPSPGLTLSRLHAAQVADAPDADELRLLAAAPALSPSWATKLRARAEWIEQQG